MSENLGEHPGETNTLDDKNPSESPSEKASESPRIRGLYDKVNISVKQLNIIIPVLALALIVCLVIGLCNRGYLVQFNSMGGSTVGEDATHKYLYGELVDPVEDPTREGYIFTGWYSDEACTREWHLDTDTVSEPVTLYAGWEKAE